MNTEPVKTYVREYEVDYIIGRTEHPYAITPYLPYAQEIAELLKSQGRTPRITEIHAGLRELK